jgi:hypothetical protein
VGPTNPTPFLDDPKQLGIVHGSFNVDIVQKKGMIYSSELNQPLFFRFQQLVLTNKRY